jgi:hypothetical protein
MAATALSPCRARAQGEPGDSTARATRVLIRVHVSDTSGTPIFAANVAVADSATHVLASASTGADGSATLSIPRVVKRVTVSARRLGYRPREEQLDLRTGDTLSITLRLTAAPASISAVVVSADQDLKRKSYFVDSAQIANSHRLILNGMDVLTKMRPDILTGRAPGCGVRNIFVNGARILYPPLNAVAVAHIARRGRGGGGSTVGSSLNSSEIWSVMWGIRAQDIKEMTYKDCFDTSMPDVHGSSALYIVLRPGVAYDPARGSYPVDSSRSDGP